MPSKMRHKYRCEGCGATQWAADGKQPKRWGWEGGNPRIRPFVYCNHLVRVVADSEPDVEDDPREDRCDDDEN